MARQPKKEKGLFTPDAEDNRVARIINRAVAKKVAAAGRVRGAKNPRIRLPKGGGKREQRGSLEKALAAALKGLTGRATLGRSTIRAKAKDTGGRSFHFQYYSVSKADSNRKHPKGSGIRESAAGAHHAYIERALAVEASYEPSGRAIDAGCVRAGSDVRGAKTVSEKDRGGCEAAHDVKEHETGPGRSRGAQAYIEHPTKIRNGEVILSSFGTIGETFQERLAFWDALEENEPGPNARVQNRIICELPHQSTPAARCDIMQRFTQEFRDLGLPYHVAIHAPGEKNDARNYHAHVVFSERPAKRMIDPADGQEKWDFAITEAYKTSSRNTRIRHPYRQGRSRALKDRNYIPGKRKEFATIVTAVMKPIDKSVVFDARSYKDMGLDISPMATVHRVLHERMRKGRIVIQNAEWTQRMVEAELMAAAQRRDADMQTFLALDQRFSLVKKAWPDIESINKSFGPKSALQKSHKFTKNAFDKLLDARLDVEYERAWERLRYKAEAATCRRVIDATEPTTANLANGTTPFTAAELEARVLLHAAAHEELAAIEIALKKTEQSLAQKHRDLRAIWSRFRVPQDILASTRPSVGPGVPPSSQTTSRKRQQDHRLSSGLTLADGPHSDPSAREQAGARRRPSMGKTPGAGGALASGLADPFSGLEPGPSNVAGSRSARHVNDTVIQTQIAQAATACAIGTSQSFSKKNLARDPMAAINAGILKAPAALSPLHNPAGKTPQQQAYDTMVAGLPSNEPLSPSQSGIRPGAKRLDACMMLHADGTLEFHGLAKDINDAMKKTIDVNLPRAEFLEAIKHFMPPDIRAKYDAYLASDDAEKAAAAVPEATPDVDLAGAGVSMAEHVEPAKPTPEKSFSIADPEVVKKAPPAQAETAPVAARSDPDQSSSRAKESAVEQASVVATVAPRQIRITPLFDPTAPRRRLSDQPPLQASHVTRPPISLDQPTGTNPPPPQSGSLGDGSRKTGSARPQPVEDLPESPSTLVPHRSDVPPSGNASPEANKIQMPAPGPAGGLPPARTEADARAYAARRLLAPRRSSNGSPSDRSAAAFSKHAISSLEEDTRDRSTADTVSGAGQTPPVNGKAVEPQKMEHAQAEKATNDTAAETATVSDSDKDRIARKKKRRRAILTRDRGPGPSR